MNREDVIQLAREASEQHYAYSFPFLERFANAIEQRTLEMAAQVADEADKYNRHISREIAAAIRALGESK